MYNIVLLHFVQNCVFKPNNLEHANLLGCNNCQCVCMTKQTVTNFLFFSFHLLPFFIAKETLRRCLLSFTGEHLDSQTAHGSHANLGRKAPPEQLQCVLAGILQISVTFTGGRQHCASKRDCLLWCLDDAGGQWWVVLSLLKIFN